MTGTAIGVVGILLLVFFDSLRAGVAALFRQGPIGTAVLLIGCLVVLTLASRGRGG